MLYYQYWPVTPTTRSTITHWWGWERGGPDCGHNAYEEVLAFVRPSSHIQTESKYHILAMTALWATWSMSAPWLRGPIKFQVWPRKGAGAEHWAHYWGFKDMLYILLTWLNINWEIMLIKAGSTLPQASMCPKVAWLTKQWDVWKHNCNLNSTFHQKNVYGTISDHPIFNTTTLSDIA